MSQIQSLPKHLAIIMDGNGRWAQKRQHSRFWGHVKGAKVARTVIEQCVKLGIEQLTLFTFSTENWNRPSIEVSFLMKLLEKQLKRELKTLMKNNVRFHCIGDLERLPFSTRKAVLETIHTTNKNTGMDLTFALSYSGRAELIQAVQRISKQVEMGYLKAHDIDENVMDSSLETAFLSDPDLIIRTSGEKRISNFFLWQASYSEFYFTDTLWPDFKSYDLLKALDAYANVERRFGKTGDQIQENINL